MFARLLLHNAAAFVQLFRTAAGHPEFAAAAAAAGGGNGGADPAQSLLLGLLDLWLDKTDAIGASTPQMAQVQLSSGLAGRPCMHDAPLVGCRIAADSLAAVMSAGLQYRSATPYMQKCRKFQCMCTSPCKLSAAP